MADASVDPDKLVVSMCGVELSRGGRETDRRDEAAVRMKDGGEVAIGVDLRLGTGRFEFLTCDLTPDYVKFNAEYTT
jgi:glutamate N-acetyltransferase/amino-acid N-acetyltransferase